MSRREIYRNMEALIVHQSNKPFNKICCERYSFSFANRNHRDNRHVGNEVKHFVSRCLIGCSCLSLFSLHLICVSQCVKIKERMYMCVFSSFFSSLSLWTCLNDNVRHHVCWTHCSFSFHIDKRSVFVFALLVVANIVRI